MHVGLYSRPWHVSLAEVCEGPGWGPLEQEAQTTSSVTVTGSISFRDGLPQEDV